MHLAQGAYGAAVHATSQRSADRERYKAQLLRELGTYSAAPKRETEIGHQSMPYS